MHELKDNGVSHAFELAWISVRHGSGTFTNVDYQELKFEFNWVVCCHQLYRTGASAEYEYFCKMAQHPTVLYINGIFKMHLDPGTDQNLSILYLVCCIFDVFFPFLLQKRSIQ